MSVRPLIPSNARDDASQPQLSKRAQSSDGMNHRRKRPNTSTACDGCQRARAKCSGPPSPCSRCVSRNVICMFNLHLDQRRRSAVRRKFEGTELYRGLLAKLVDTIRESNDLSTQHIIDVLRSGTSTEETLDNIDETLQQLRDNDQPTGVVVGSLGELHPRASAATTPDGFQPGNETARHTYQPYRQQVRSKSSSCSHRNRSLENGRPASDEVFDLLRSLPEKDAQGILQRIRSGVDLSTILKHVKTGDALLQMALVPETRFRYEFPYRSEMPDYLRPANPYLDSLLYESVSLFSQRPDSNVGTYATSHDTKRLNSEESKSMYFKPFHSAQVIEPKLTDVKLSQWTHVCYDDILMRDLLKVFFRCEYQFTAAFQKDLFLEDMAVQRTDFCSSLLVNIVLAYSCVSYPPFSNRAEYWNPQTLEYRFLAEAKRIWELEANEPRITTIQAGILFTVFYNLCGLDEIGKTYRIQAITLANKLHLWDRAAYMENDRMRHGGAFTAWTLYNWETLTAFSFMNPPLLTQPPNWPLPDPSEDAGWYGEIWVKYPLNHSPSPSSFGHVFRAKCHFRLVMNEFCHVAYSRGRGITIDEAHWFHERLNDWYRSLTEALLPQKIVLPSHLQLHVYYHHLILTMYEPLYDMKTNSGPSPAQVVTEAKRYLQTLVRLYYLRHGFEAMDLFIVIPLMLIAYDCTDAIREETTETELEVLRSTLCLVAQGLYNQRRNHYLAEALFRVIRGRLQARDAFILRDFMDLDEYDAEVKQQMAQAVRSHWPVSVVKNVGDMKSHVLTNLVENYAHLNIRVSPA